MSVNDHRIPPTLEIFEVKPGPNEKAATYIFGNEDHTLGNSLRYMLSQNPDTDFVGYSVPHPYDPKMNLRLQTKNEPALKVLKKGFKDLEEVSNLLDEKFIDAVNEFYRSKG
jgi:DNA-directed RNA polymerases I and III subunit RPAC2